MYIERLFAPHWGWIGALFLCPNPWANTRDGRGFIGASLFIPQTSRATVITATSGRVAERAAVWVEIVATTDSVCRRDASRNVMAVASGEITRASVDVRRRLGGE